MVKCRDCGRLGLRRERDEEVLEAAPGFRGKGGDVTRGKMGVHPFPICGAGMPHLGENLARVHKDKASTLDTEGIVREALEVEIVCTAYVPYRIGMSPS